MKATVYDDRICSLGEGPLWHPLLKQLFWFDINGKKLLSRKDDQLLEWQFDRHVSAAGWVDENTLLIATETNLTKFTLNDSNQVELCPLEHDNALTRSNDGRADPWGGFWIGTMGKKAEFKAGSIYRFYRGDLRELASPVTIPNAICFSPNAQYAYYADTIQKKIWRQALYKETGWPEGDPVLFLDLSQNNLNPDGAVVDSEGNLWNAQWGASRIACYSPEGKLITAIGLSASQASCPSFGGNGLNDLYITTASESLTDNELAAEPNAGKTFICPQAAVGQAEHQVIL